MYLAEAYPTTLDLSRIPTLLSLVLQVDLSNHSAPVIASWIAELLHGVNASDIKVSGILRAMEIPIDWTPLASSLHPERFPCLQHFTVEFIGWHHWREVSSERLQEIVDTVKRELQELEERGVLECRMVNEG
jgi:hypothetical protein